MTPDSFYSYYGITYFYCYDTPYLPTMDLLFGGYWLQVSVEDIVVNFDGVYCAIFMLPTYYGDARLGSALLRNFYTIYDMKMLRMGFASLVGQGMPKIDPV